MLKKAACRGAGGLVKVFQISSAQSFSFATQNDRSSVDEAEVKTFSQVKDWWSPDGSMRPLHAYNYARTEYMKKIMHSYSSNRNPLDKYRPFENLTVLDVGCGGGLLAESLARLGANVTGIDVTPESVRIAKAHARMDPSLSKKITYQNVKLEDLAKEGKQYDIVSSVEVLEHVNYPDQFIKNISDVTKDNGFTFVSTINKTVQSYFVVILLAEYFARTIPVGTHNWQKFLKPEEVQRMLEAHRFTVLNTQGFFYDPIRNTMTLSNNADVNYFVAARKHPAKSEVSVD